MALQQITQLKQQMSEAQERASTAFSILDTTRSRFMLLGTIVLLGIGYLWLVNSSATTGFYLSDLESRVGLLQDEYQALEIEQTALTSLTYIEERSGDLQLVAAGRAQYADSGSAVALVDNE